MKSVDGFIAELKDTIPPLTIANLLRISGALLVIVVVSSALTAALWHFLPDLEQFSRFGYFGIFLITLISSSTIFFPLPGYILWLSLIVTLDLNLALAALVGSVGGTLGEITGYYAGYAGRKLVPDEYAKQYTAAEKWMGRYGGLAIAAFAFVPLLIFDIVGLVAGSLKYNVWKFLFFCWMGRLPRSFIEVYTYAYTGKALLDLVATCVTGE